LSFTVSVSVEFEVMRCGECGERFALSKPFYDDRKRDGNIWYCPNGHPRVFREPELDVLRRERDLLKQRLARKDDELAAARRDEERAVKKARRLEKRASAGTCPCCNRTFMQMSRHMKTKHPDFVENNVVRFKTS
jgi:ssDNA-binding Zn-finger/Zn-ribbon topoisomerase 1